MWQDWVIFGVQFSFAIALIPTVFHPTQKPTLSTSVMTMIGVYSIAGVYASLGLWFAAGMASIIATLWAILALQRFRLNKKGDPGER